MSSAGRRFIPGRAYDGRDIMKRIGAGSFFLIAQLLSDFHVRCLTADLKGTRVADNKSDLGMFTTIFEMIKEAGVPVSLNIAEISHSMLFKEPSIISYD